MEGDTRDFYVFALQSEYESAIAEKLATIQQREEREKKRGVWRKRGSIPGLPGQIGHCQGKIEPAVLTGSAPDQAFSKNGAPLTRAFCRYMAGRSPCPGMLQRSWAARVFCSVGRKAGSYQEHIRPPVGQPRPPPHTRNVRKMDCSSACFTTLQALFEHLG